MSNNKQEMLENLLIMGSLTRNVLASSTTHNSERNNLVVVKNLSDDNLVKIKDIVRTHRDKKKTTDHYLISAAGVRCLREDAIRDAETVKKPHFDSRRVGTRFPWLRYINEESTKGMAVLGDFNTEKEGTFKLGDAAMLSEMAGASLPVFVQDYLTSVSDVSTAKLSGEMAYAYYMSAEESEYTAEELLARKKQRDFERQRQADPNIKTAKKPTEIMTDAVMNWAKAEIDPDVTYGFVRDNYNYTKGELLTSYPIEAEDFIRFVAANTVKYIYLSIKPQHNKVENDVSRCRYAGLLQSRVRSLFLFTTYNPVLTWPNKSSSAENNSYEAWESKLSSDYLRSRDEKLCGALIIKSPAQFRKLWHLPKNNGHKFSVLGYGYNRLFVIEDNKTGAANLRDIMLTSTAEYRRRELDRVLNPEFSESLETGFEENTEFMPHLFPVTAVLNGVRFYFFIGTWFDIKQLQRVLTVICKDNAHEFGVICEQWQHPYYKAVYPGFVTYWQGRDLQEIYDDEYGRETIRE